MAELSRIQKFFTSLVPAETAAAMEAHSRAWLVQCPHCGFERSIWELGGIRYGATGKPRMPGRCTVCGRSGWHKVHKAADFPTIAVSSWPILRLILLMLLVTLPLTLLLLWALLRLAGAG